MQVIHLGKCYHISHRAVKTVLEACHQLKYMNLTDCYSIVEQSELCMTSLAAENQSVQFASYSEKKMYEIKKTSALQPWPFEYSDCAINACLEQLQP